MLLLMTGDISSSCRLYAYVLAFMVGGRVKLALEKKLRLNPTGL